MTDKNAPEEESEPTMRGVVSGSLLFDRFTLEKVLGRGGMGIVWLARDQRLERHVALKLVPGAVCFDAAAHEDLKRETRKSLLLTHPNIVRIFDFMEDGRTAAISMEYVDGATLSSLRVQQEKKCFETDELAAWITSLCDALAYAHDSVRVIHRDLKPANLMVNSRSELKVTDFGIACSLRDSMSCSSVRTSSGTLNYMSPQQMLGEDPSPSDDIYAVGALLFELLSSKPPFFGGHVATQVREVTPPTIAERRKKLRIEGGSIPAHWEETIAACLAKDPAQRPSSAAEVGRRLRLGSPLEVSAPKAVPLIRQQVPLGLAALVCVASVLVAIVAILYHLKAPSPQVALPMPPSTSGYAIEIPRALPASPPQAEEAAETASAPPAAFPIFTVAAPPEMSNLQLMAAPATLAAPDFSEGETTVFESTVQGSVTITSVPAGAEIFLGETSLGKTPLTTDLPLGKQDLVARHPSYPRKTQTVTVGSEGNEKIVFRLRNRSRASSKAKPTPTPNALGKIGNTLKKVFGPRPTPPPPKKKKR